MFWKFLEFVNNIEIKIKKLDKLSIRVIILVLSVVIFAMALSSGFLAAVIMLIVILAVVASLLHYILGDAKPDGDY